MLESSFLYWYSFYGSVHSTMFISTNKLQYDVVYMEKMLQFIAEERNKDWDWKVKNRNIEKQKQRKWSKIFYINHKMVGHDKINNAYLGFTKRINIRVDWF